MQQNDRDESLEEVVERNYDFLRLYARTRLRGFGATYQPTEAVHNAYLKVHSMLEKSEGGKPTVALLILAMRHIVVDRARKKSGRHPSHVEPDALPAPNLPSPESLEAEAMMLNCIDELRRKLPKVAEVFILRRYGDLTIDEVARALDMPVITVQRYTEKAQTLLAACMNRLDRPDAPGEPR